MTYLFDSFKGVIGDNQCRSYQNPAMDIEYTMISFIMYNIDSNNLISNFYDQFI